MEEALRHGKSRTAGKFVEWLLGNDNQKELITTIFDETLAAAFSKSVRKSIQIFKADEGRIVFSDVFPGVEIELGINAMNLWSLNGGYNNYLATSPTGTAIDFDDGVFIIDDQSQDAKAANNIITLKKHWDWFTNTMLSRLVTAGKITFIKTKRYSKKLTGVTEKEAKKIVYEVKHISIRAETLEMDTMLCESIQNKKEYRRKMKTMGADIASANYQQEPIDLKGRLYQKFSTYETRSNY
ncbi:hypothetical protein [Enterococcus faecalis]|uniref:hypothetical protein n=1 Tax=Enterococcus faecalis TaxID=1351 RepID=UPI003D9FFA9B